MKQKILLLCFLGLLIPNFAKSSCMRKYISIITQMTKSMPCRVKSMPYKVMIGLGIGAAAGYGYHYEQSEKKQDRDVFIYHIVSSNCCLLGPSDEVASSIESIQKYGMIPLNQLVQHKDWASTICYEKVKRLAKLHDKNVSDEEISQACEQIRLCILSRLKSLKSSPFSDEYDYSYFKPEGSSSQKHAHIAVKVNPYKTYVYNMDVKNPFENNNFDQILRRKDQYLCSKVLLADYLRYEKQAKEMEKQHPELIVIMDPETAKPFYVTRDDPKNTMVKIKGRWIENTSAWSGDYNPEIRIFGKIRPERIIVIKTTASD